MKTILHLSLRNRWRGLRLWFTLFVILTTSIASADTEFSFRRESPPGFTGNEIPRAPLQGERCTPPRSSLPDSFVSATAALFDHGMADPRGCEYREIELGVGNVWQKNDGIVTTRGWVLPGEGGQRFAIAWNGLVYPVLSIGEPGDLRKDVADAIERMNRPWMSRAFPERKTVLPDLRFPIQGCLLLRLGEVALATEFWDAVEIARKSSYDDDSELGVDGEEPILSEEDPYLDWARDWAWGLLDRAICAHMRGDDGLALASARLLADVEARIEAEAAERGFRLFELPSAPYRRAGYLYFLAPLPALLDDQERRADRRGAPVSLDGISRIESRETRIAALIDRLEDLAPRQMGQPAGLDRVETDPVGAALLAEGHAAIEPLLDCLVTDCVNRLTRAVSFSRDFHRTRRIHSVDQMIVRLLLQLMDARAEEVGIDWHELQVGQHSNEKIADRFREYWSEYGALSLPERWYRTLADDQAGREAWESVLFKMLRPARVDGRIDETRIAGETLRDKTSPTVVELLRMRATALAESATDANERSRVVSFFLSAERWEGPPLVQPAAEFQERIIDGRARFRRSHRDASRDLLSIARIAQLRARHGDTEGLDQYAGLITEAAPEQFDRAVLQPLEPLWRFSDHDTLREAAAEMFGNPDSPWGTISWIFQPWPWSDGPIASPLLIVPEFRELVLQGLRDRTVIGKAERYGEGGITITYSDGRGLNAGQYAGATELPPDTTVTIRRCDVFAEALSTIAGFPEMNLVWPEPKREQAVSAMKEILSHSPHRLRTRERPATFGGRRVELIDETE